MAQEITKLCYRVVGTTPFADPPAIHIENAIGVFHLANDILHVRLRDPQHSTDYAQKVIEPFLRAWEFQAEIIEGYPVISFIHDSIVTVSEDASELRVHNDPILSQGSDSSNADRVLVILRRQYPDPPEIIITQDMQLIWARFRNARYEIGEPLQSAAYYSLTVVEKSAGGRRQAADRYNIQFDVLRKLGELSSTRGDSRNARKALPSDAKPLTWEEKRWIEYAIRAILLQLGISATGIKPDALSLDSLPMLPNDG